MNNFSKNLIKIILLVAALLILSWCSSDAKASGLGPSGSGVGGSSPALQIINDYSTENGSVNITSSLTNIITSFSIGSPQTGDYLLVSVTLNCTKQGTAGVVDIDIDDGGPSAVVWVFDESNVIHSFYANPSTQYDVTFTTLGRVTTGGSTTITVSGNSQGSDCNFAHADLSVLVLRQ